MTDFAVASDRSTPGLERANVGAWILRNGLGETGRANSATAHGEPGMAIPSAIERVEAWYAERGRPSMFQVYDETPDAVAAELDRRGYDTGEITDIRSAPVDAVLGAMRPTAWTIEIVASMPSFLGSQLPENRATEILSVELPRWFAIASQGGEVLAAGMALGDDDLVGVFAMRTHPDRQGEGAGSAVISGLLAEGRRRGASTAWLQVEADNRRAAAWYERLGFERRTGYRYRIREFTQKTLTQQRLSE